MKTTTFTFTLPPGAARRFGDTGRDMLALAMDGVPEAEKLFHYNGGKPCQGMPFTRIHSRDNRLIVTSVVSGTNDIVLAALPHISEKLAEICGARPSICVNKSSTGIRHSGRLRLYKARNIVVARGLTACAKFEALTPDGQRAAVHRVLCAGIERQANELMLDTPELPDVNGMEITFVANRAKLIVKDGKVREYGVVASAQFYWNAEINGSWAVGGLTSRGHGRIWYKKPNEGQ